MSIPMSERRLRPGMRWATITKEYRFEAAHQLRYHRGHCARPHGHSYRFEVAVRGLVNDYSDPGEHGDQGMVADFATLSDIVKTQVLEVLDHQDLNAMLAVYTTAENIAHWIFQRVDAALAETGMVEMLVSVRLWETATGSALVHRSDFSVFGQ